MAVGGTEYFRRRAASAPATPALSPANSPPGSPHRAPQHRWVSKSGIRALITSVPCSIGYFSKYFRRRAASAPANSPSGSPNSIGRHSPDRVPCSGVRSMRPAGSPLSSARSCGRRSRSPVLNRILEHRPEENRSQCPKTT
ncbi:hypothetical protein MSG28_005079 [Choristoneura fumiferana]|uniref:Uncharacterized protein n=1 Tax=Choristoneura fumiferana TaxID=7141 RepID=A0ACC0JPS4_CHOFU|nr:hypothetical protein MSG28_005079 [Choristoneura fumiferana]